MVIKQAPPYQGVKYSTLKIHPLVTTVCQLSALKASISDSKYNTYSTAPCRPSLGNPGLAKKILSIGVFEAVEFA